MLEDAREPLDVGVALQEQGRCLSLNVDDVTGTSVREPHDGKRPRHAGVTTYGVGQSLQRDLRHVGARCQVLKLGCRRAGAGSGSFRTAFPLASWLPLVPGLSAHGLRHGHRTWMAEDGIPDILAERRLGHEVPGMRGLYTHVSDRMREALVQALRARWEESLQARAAIRPHSPIQVLDELLTPHRRQQPDPGAANGTVRHLASRIPPGRQGEVDLPNSSQAV